MDQIRQMLASLSTRQRVTILMAVLLMAAGAAWLLRWRKDSDFRPLYTGLAAEDMAAVAQKVKETGVEYRLSETGNAIAVPSAKVAEVRLELASAGLPRSGRAGFEIFDKNNLGATEFVEHINYQRAVEGELERSVMAISEVEQARVHITFAKQSVFTSMQDPAKASVMVKLKANSRLAERNVTALRHLASSAVEGLSPDSVSILDMQGNLLSRPRLSPEDEESETQLEYRQKIERSLTQKISATLDPLLGTEHYRATVLVDCDRTSGDQTEDSPDPEHSVVLTQQTSEERTAAATASGVPGTSSNLPRPAARPGSGDSTTTRHTENTTYQTGHITRTTKLPYGKITKVSVGVLLDQQATWTGTGATARMTIVPPSPEVLKSVREMVAAAVGLDSGRGDVLTVETQPFESTRVSAPPPPPPSRTPAPHGPLDDLTWDKVLGTALPVALVIAALIYLRRRGKPAKMQAPTLPQTLASAPLQAALPLAPDSVELGETARSALAGGDAKPPQAELSAEVREMEVLVKHLAEAVNDDPATSVRIIRAWLQESK